MWKAPCYVRTPRKPFLGVSADPTLPRSANMELQGQVLTQTVWQFHRSIRLVPLWLCQSTHQHTAGTTLCWQMQCSFHPAQPDMPSSVHAARLVFNRFSPNEAMGGPRRNTKVLPSHVLKQQITCPIHRSHTNAFWLQLWDSFTLTQSLQQVGAGFGRVWVVYEPRSSERATWIITPFVIAHTVLIMDPNTLTALLLK